MKTLGILLTVLVGIIAMVAFLGGCLSLMIYAHDAWGLPAAAGLVSVVLAAAITAIVRLGGFR